MPSRKQLYISCQRPRSGQCSTFCATDRLNTVQGSVPTCTFSKKAMHMPIVMTLSSSTGMRRAIWGWQKR